jgi:hypothetical protein
MAQTAIYRGPQCPRCRRALPEAWVNNGQIVCPECGGDFEATLFQPVEQKAEAVRIIDESPEGANLCANHVRNAAVTSCQRCGLFICSLCDMNVGSGSFCPSCFSRLQKEGGLQEAAKSYLDYTLMGRSAIIIGIVMWPLAIVTGLLAMYYAVRGVKQRREKGRSVVGPLVLFIFGLGQFGTVAVFFGLMIWGLMNA